MVSAVVVHDNDGDDGAAHFALRSVAHGTGRNWYCALGWPTRRSRPGHANVAVSGWL
jgi:hypothetical protein